MAESVWKNLEYPPAPEDRPWVFINMVTTIDGKIITGDRDEDVHDLGSATDHATLKAVEQSAHGILMGAATIRATPRMNLPSHLVRFCLTGKGQVLEDHGFFQGSAWLLMPDEAPSHPRLPVYRIGSGRGSLAGALKWMRQELGIEKLLCEGGSEVNGMILGEDLVDELFWTIAPKVKLGRDVPTYADGEPLPRSQVSRWTIVDQVTHEDEIFLRYRRHR